MMNESFAFEQSKRNGSSVSHKEAELKHGIVVQHQCIQAVIGHLGGFEEIEMTMKVPESSVRRRFNDISLSSSVTTHSYF